MPTASTVGDDDEVPGYRNYVVFTDESGMHGGRYYGFGSLWIPWERRGDLQEQVRELQVAHGLDDELKWKKVTKRSEPLVRELITWFFSRPWLMFHCIVIRKGVVDHTKHTDADEAQRKHFSMLLKNKIAFFAKGGGKLYRVRVDPLPWRYQRADEVVHKVVNAQLKAEFGQPLIHDVRAKNSKETVGIQLADVLLGAVMAAWQEEATAEPKKRVISHVADALGWPSLRHDTVRDEWKFNVWYFHDPTSGDPREARTRPVKLKHPMPRLSRSRRR